MLHLYQKIEEHLGENLPFVVYSKPDSNRIAAIFQHDDALHEISDYSERGFAFVSFDGKRKYYISDANADIYIDYIKNYDFFYPNKAADFDEKAKIDFEQLVQKGLVAISNTEFEKVVLSRKEPVATSEFDVVKTFTKLLHLYPSAFKYCLFHPKVGFWMGASPEQFLQIDGLHLKTVALAGTQVYSENVTWEAKEQQEQAFVSDFIVSNLEAFTTEISASDPYTFQAGTIAHIKTDIVAQLREQHAVGKVIEKLHPTPAVCGVPKEKSKEFILENEGYDREFYSGFLGELNVDIVSAKRDKSDLFVNLRCMKIQENAVDLYMGCGITKDSLPEKEFLETVTKSMTMKKVL